MGGGRRLSPTVFLTGGGPALPLVDFEEQFRGAGRGLELAAGVLPVGTHTEGGFTVCGHCEYALDKAFGIVADENFPAVVLVGDDLVQSGSGSLGDVHEGEHWLRILLKSGRNGSFRQDLGAGS